MGRFGLLGGSLGHSFSPRIHELLADYEYRLYERTGDELENFFEREGLDGVNVTIPYKKVIIDYCDELSDAAARIGSVNTVVKKAGKLKGFNTDYSGFLYLLDRNGIDASGKRCLILGNGGAVRAVAMALFDSGAESITVLSRKALPGETLRIGEIFARVDSYDNIALYRDTDILINTTPVGMYPTNGRSPVSLDVFAELYAVIDIIYNPLKTELLLEAEDIEKGAAPLTANGLSMLVAQASAASLLFTGQIDDEREFISRLDRKLLESIISRIDFENRNIILIGMAGCGKSTLGKILADELHRDLIDTDTEVEKLAGTTIPKLFEEKGEEHFRELETSVLRMACSAGGRVIATGGGIVTRKENYHPMRENGLIVFIDRPAESLATEGRPLSLKHGAAQLLKERLPLYNALADIVTDGNAETLLKRLREPLEIR